MSRTNFVSSTFDSGRTRNASMRLMTRRGAESSSRPNGAGLPGLEVRDEGFLVAIPEFSRIEVGGLAVEDALRQIEHIRREGDRRYLGKVILASRTSYG
jgi:hypothetical protein